MAKDKGSLDEFIDDDDHPAFEVDLHGWGSRVKMNGQELLGVRDVQVHQPLDGPLTVTIEFAAKSVNGVKDDDA